MTALAADHASALLARLPRLPSLPHSSPTGYFVKLSLTSTLGDLTRGEHLATLCFTRSLALPSALSLHLRVSCLGGAQDLTLHSSFRGSFSSHLLRPAMTPLSGPFSSTYADASGRFRLLALPIASPEVASLSLAELPPSLLFFSLQRASSTIGHIRGESLFDASDLDLSSSHTDAGLTRRRSKKDSLLSPSSITLAPRSHLLPLPR